MANTVLPVFSENAPAAAADLAADDKAREIQQLEQAEKQPQPKTIPQENPHAVEAASPSPDALPPVATPTETFVEETRPTGLDWLELTGEGVEQAGEQGASVEETGRFSRWGYAQSMDPKVFAKRLNTLATYQEWVDDAIEFSLKFPVEIPVRDTQELLWEANLHKTAFQEAYEKGRHPQAAMEYERAFDLFKKILLMTSPSANVEGRAIWLDRGSIVDSGSPDGMVRLMKKLHRAGINVVYFETVNAGYPVYPSKLLPQNPSIVGWDPLQVAVETGHKLGMEVHAWVWTFAVGNKRHNPIVGNPDNYPGPMLSKPELASEAMRTPSGALNYAGDNEYWLSPASPKARQFLKDLFSEIVTTYPVDGLQLDYIRYPFQKSGTQMGFEAVARSRFQQQASQVPGGAGKTWIAWKTYQVTSFVHDMSNTLKALNPKLKLSVAVFPMSRASRIVAIQQDWETWIQNGWIDTLNPMTYTSSQNQLQQVIRDVAHAAGKEVLVYPGIGIHRLGADEMVGHLELLRENGIMGSTLFAMAHLDDSKIEALRLGPYKERDPLSPHKDPLKAANFLIQEYSGEFHKLKGLGELNGIPLKTLSQVEDLLKNMTEESSRLMSSSVSDSAQVFSSLSGESASLKSLTRQWTGYELEDKHPFRELFFQEKSQQIHNLIQYASTRPAPPPGSVALTK